MKTDASMGFWNIAKKIIIEWGMNTSVKALL